ncbi:MAG: hypothetical protein ACSHYA_17075 [Opitutaceae bacterium]
MPEAKAKCKKCSKVILQVTANRTNGFCAPCAREEGTISNLYRKDEIELEEVSDFLCCECGSTKEESVAVVLHRLSPPNPWATVAGRATCASCGSVIPSHLVFRKKDLSKEEAKKEWVEVFKVWPLSNIQVEK